MRSTPARRSAPHGYRCRPDAELGANELEAEGRSPDRPKAERVDLTVSASLEQSDVEVRDDFIAARGHREMEDQQVVVVAPTGKALRPHPVARR